MGSYPGTVDINFLGPKPAKGKVISAVKNADTTVKNQVIDGFVKAPQSSPTSSPTLSTHTPADATILHRRGRKATTLMRGALKKPADGFSNRIQNLRPGLNPQRELRARQTSMHSKIHRFGGQATPSKPAAANEVLQGELVSRSAFAKRQPQPSASAAVALPSMVTSASHHRIERMLDAALMRADSHKQAMKYQAAKHFWQRPGFLGRHHGVKLSVLALLMLGVSFFIAWQKIPQVSVRIAGIRAHLSATIPGYRPSGYGLANPAAVSNHSVTIQYASSIDKSKTYTVKEQPSNQTSISLAANNTSPNQQVETTQANGVPIVIIAHKAMCVSQGIETTVEDKANLAPDELLNIAKSVCG